MEQLGSASERDVGRASTVTPRGASSSGGCVQLASVLTMRGPDARSAAEGLSFARIDKSSHRNGGQGVYTPADPIAAPSPPVVKGARYAAGTASSSVREERRATPFGGNRFEVSACEWADDQSVELYHSSHCLNGYHRSASIVSNSQSILPYLNRPVAKAAAMFQSGAYLHQYSKFSIERDDFEQAFLNLGQVIQNYESLL
jgi:hypothetical protein